MASGNYDHGNLMSLPEEILGRIFFSGYLSTKWYNTVCSVLVNRRIRDLARTYIASVENGNRIELDAITRKSSPLSVLGIWSIAQNLVLLDLSFSVLDFSPELGEMFVKMKATLRGLSLRATSVPDDFVCSYVSKLTRLKYLSLSQLSAGKQLITDVGGCALVTLTQLKWLNISMTSITHKTLLSLQSSIPHLQHLDMYSCRLLTDEAIPALLKWRLQSLDISNCRLITLQGFELMCDKRWTPLNSTLENLACSYCISIPVVRGLPLLLQLPKLARLDFRKSTSEVIPKELERTVRMQLDVAILVHEDQLVGLKNVSVIPASPPRNSICPILSWPYSTTEL